MKFNGNEDVSTVQNHQQDGAPPHYYRDVHVYLDDNLPEYWIGQRCPNDFPSHSSDLSPLNFYLWGTLKNVVKKPATLAALREEIEMACAAITEDSFANVARTALQRPQKWADAHGGHFEQLL